MAYSRKGSSQTYEDMSQCETIACCLVCLDPHDKPVILDCNHVFCEQCVLHYFKQHCKVGNSDDNTISIPCPTCQKLTHVPPCGIVGLSLERRQSRSEGRIRKVSMIGDTVAQRCEPCIYKTKTAEADYYCNKCQLNFCQNCKNSHDQHSVFSSHSLIHISNKDVINLSCAQHGKSASIYFCNDCNIPACAICVIQEHNKHNSINLVDALSARRDNLKQCLNAIGPKLEKMNVKLRKLIQNFCNSEDLKTRNGCNGNSSTESLPKSSYPENIELIKLNPRRDSNDNVDYEIRAMDREIKKIQKLYSLSSKVTEVSQSKKLLIVYDELMSRLQTVINIELECLQTEIALKIEREVESVMHSSNGLTPSLSYTSLQDKTSKTGTSNKSSPEPSILSLDEFGPDQSDHFMLFKPKLLWKVEKGKGEITEMWNPSGISFHPHGDIIVAEYDILTDKNNRLRIYNAHGDAKGEFGDGLIKPLGVSVNREGNIAVTDCKGKRLKIFSPNGNWQTDIGKGSFGWPYGIVCNSKGQYIVSDTFHDTISIFGHDGRKIKTFGASGAGSSEFKNPFHLSVDSNDNIVISDSGNKCVKVFDIRGEFLYVSSESHKSKPHDINQKKRRKLKGPRGIAVDIKDNIIVADDSGKVGLLDPRGRYIRHLLTDEDSVKYPEALATNKQGHLAVTEWNPNNMFAIKVFSMYE